MIKPDEKETPADFARRRTIYRQMAMDIAAKLPADKARALSVIEEAKRLLLDVIHREDGQ